MTPTRELALQIFRECKKFCKPLNLRAVCVYGGTGISEQVIPVTTILYYTFPEVLARRICLKIKSFISW